MGHARIWGIKSTISDYPAEMISTALNEENEPYTDETQLLAMGNDLLYRLMDCQRVADQWHDEEDLQQKSEVEIEGDRG